MEGPPTNCNSRMLSHYGTPGCRWGAVDGPFPLVAAEGGDGVAGAVDRSLHGPLLPDGAHEHAPRQLERGGDGGAWHGPGGGAAGAQRPRPAAGHRVREHQPVGVAVPASKRSGSLPARRCPRPRSTRGTAGPCGGPWSGATRWGTPCGTRSWCGCARAPSSTPPQTPSSTTSPMYPNAVWLQTDRFAVVPRFSAGRYFESPRNVFDGICHRHEGFRVEGHAPQVLPPGAGPRPVLLQLPRLHRPLAHGGVCPCTASLCGAASSRPAPPATRTPARSSSGRRSAV